MALIASLGIDDVYKRLKSQWREIRAAALRVRSATAAGPVTFSILREYYEQLYSSIAFCDAEIAQFEGATLASYARAQEAAAANYDPASEFAAMRTAAVAVLAHVAAALPPNSAHTVSAGRFIEPTFGTAQTATLRGLLDTLIASISVTRAA